MDTGDFVRYKSGRVSTWMTKEKDEVSGIHFIYVLKCQDGKYYCGMTKDIVRRLVEHISRRGAKFTRRNKPLKLVYLELADCHSDAINKETRISKKIKGNRFIESSDGCNVIYEEVRLSLKSHGKKWVINNVKYVNASIPTG